MKTKHQLFIILILVCITEITFSQVKTLTNVRPNPVTNSLGWDGTGGNSGTLEIRNDFNSDINFFTNTTQKATLFSGGNFSIGNTNNTYKLDVSGDMNISSGQAFRIGTNKMLWESSTAANCLFVGLNAGSNGGGASQNTLVGASAGGQLSGGMAFGNSYFGYQAGYGNTGGIFKGSWNTCLGDETMIASNTAEGNTCVGWQAGNVNTADMNTFIGYNSGLVNTSTTGNVFVGANTGSGNTGGGNTFLGGSAGGSNTTAHQNTFLGNSAGSANTSLKDNVAVGYLALGLQSYNGSVSSYNVAVGNKALYSNQPVSPTTSGTNNTALGYEACTLNTTGYQNVAVGRGAGYTNTTGYNNTFIGYNADNTAAATINNAAAIGANTVVKFSNNMVLGNNSTKVGINLSSSSSAIASPLSVGGVGSSVLEAYIYNPTSGSSYAGLKVETITGATLSENGYAIIGNVTSGTAKMYGVQGTSFNSTVQTTGTAAGVYGYAGNAQSGYNYGVWGRLDGSNNGAGIYAHNGSAASVPGQYACYIDGELRTTDATPEKPTDAFWTFISDSRTKKDITDFTDGLDIVRKIRVVNFKFNGVGGLPTETTNIGVIAQEVQQVASYCIGKSKIIVNESEKANFANDIIETIKNDSTGDTYIAEILNYNPNGLFYAMLNSIKQLDSIVNLLQNKLGGLRTNNSGDSTQGNSDVPVEKKENTLQVELANNSQTILYQNEPNPFDGSTVIRYFIPDNITGNAYVGFYDMYGKEIKKLEITERGFGKIDASTENLASGIYSYSIVIDGKTIDSKTMLKTK